MKDETDSLQPEGSHTHKASLVPDGVVLMGLVVGIPLDLVDPDARVFVQQGTSERFHL